METNKTNNFIETRSFEKLQEMLLNARQNSNKNTLSLKQFKEAGINEVIFETYKKDVEKLYNSTVKYIVYKYSNEVDEKQLKSLRSKIFDNYKMLLGYTKDINEVIIVNSNDIEDIISYAKKFMNDNDNLKNNAINSVNMFRKNIEIMLGIKLANKQVLTKEEATIIRKTRNLTKKINNLTEKLKDITLSTEDIEVIRGKIKETQDQLNELNK